MRGVGGLEVYGVWNHRLVRDLEISFAVIRLEVSGLKKTGFLYLLDLFVERKEKGWCDLLCVEHF